MKGKYDEMLEPHLSRFDKKQLEYDVFTRLFRLWIQYKDGHEVVFCIEPDALDEELARISAIDFESIEVADDGEIFINHDEKAIDRQIAQQQNQAKPHSYHPSRGTYSSSSSSSSMANSAFLIGWAGGI